MYLDYNATTPVDLRVLEAMEPYLGWWFGNPSSDNAYGTEPRNALAAARARVAALIGAGHGTTVFTGSGSETGTPKYIETAAELITTAGAAAKN